MDSSSGEQAGSHLPRKLEVSVSSFLSEPTLDIDSSTLELSLPEDAVRPTVHHVESCNSQDWEDVETFEIFNDLDSNIDILLNNHNFPQQMDMPYLSDGNGFQESATDNYPSDISKDDQLGHLVRNAKSKSLVTNQELELVNSAKEKEDFNKNSKDAKTSSNSNFAEKDNEASSSKPVSYCCEDGKMEGAVNARQSEGIVKPLQAHPEYTENFNNYKVCRVIAPGVKECLILETGEQVKCDKRQKLKAVEANLRKSTLKSENSPSVETTSIVTVAPTAPPPSPLLPLSSPFSPLSSPFSPLSSPFPPVSSPFSPLSSPFPPVSSPFPPVSSPFPPVSSPFPPLNSPPPPPLGSPPPPPPPPPLGSRPPPPLGSPPPLSSPPPPLSSPHPPPPPLSSSPDITDHSAPTPTKLGSDFPNRSQASASSDKENVNSEVCLSPQLTKKAKISENSPCHSPLHEKQVKANSCDEAAADFSGQDKLSKKVFKITKAHVEDSAVYFGNLKLGRGMNKGCPRSFILGSCPRNKISTVTSQESKNESEDKKENRNTAAANLDLTTDEDEPASPSQPLTIQIPLHSAKKFLNFDNANGLSPTGYYSDPCQMKGTSWFQHLNLVPVEVGKSFDELRKENVPRHSLAGMEWYRTIPNKQDSLFNRTAIPEVVTASNALKSVDTELAPSKSGPVPNFKSLQERQVTWMLHQLEEQHLKTMKLQYEQHQRNIQRIQEDMEAEILNQQASFQQKIKTSKNALIKEAFGRSINPHISLRPIMGHPNFNSYDADIDLSDTEDSEDNLSLDVMSLNEQSLFVVPPTDNHQPQASQASPKLSPVSPRRGSFSPLTDHSTLTHTIRSPLDPGLITDGRILQGGVYTTAFPLSKSTLMLKSPTLTEISSKPQRLDTDPHFPSVLGDDLKSETALLQELEQRHNQRMQQQQLSSSRNFDQLTDDQLTETLSLSINDSRGNLREKHAKHLSDLRLYYEKEIKELRDALNNTESVSSQSAYKKLVEENLLLTKKCQEKEEELAQQKARDYKQQVQAYQAQLKTYAQRCTDLEKLLNDFKHQLYQETAHNHRKETRLKELESEHLKQNSAIEEMIKLRGEYLEDNKQKQATIQKLVTRYEKLEKEYNIIKESLTVAEERYFEANAEILYVRRENARLDFDNKRLMRENENLRQKIGSFKFFGDRESENLNNASVNNSSSKSPRSSQRNLSSQTRQAELDLMREVGGKEMSEAFENQFTSPIMAAERELRKLRSSKKLSALGGKPTNSITELGLPDGILVDLPLSITTKTKAKTNQRQLTKDLKSKSNTSTSHHTGMESSKLSGKNKVPFQPKEVNNSTRYDIRLNDVSNSLVKDQQPASLHQDKSNNAGSADKSMESKLSQLCSRPQFEDLYSSLTKVQNQLESSPITVSKTQQKFQVTLDTIKKLEDRYDDLQAEKIQLEAALSRIPMSGRVDRKARQRKEDLENKLDAVERELGSVRMSLKRYNVLKSSI